MSGPITTWAIGDVPHAPLPLWARSVALRFGVLYVPAAIAGPEEEITLCAVADGQTMISHHGHMLVPADWMRSGYPKTADLVQLIQQRVEDAEAGRPEPRRQRQGVELGVASHE